MEKTNEMKVLEDLALYLKQSVDFEPFSEWGRGAKDGFQYALNFLNYLCELHGVKVETMEFENEDDKQRA